MTASIHYICRFDSELAALALATLMRLSGSGSTVLIAFGRNANGAEEFLEEASEAFRVQKLDGEHLHPSFVGAPDDIKAYMVQWASQQPLSLNLLVAATAEPHRYDRTHRPRGPGSVQDFFPGGVANKAPLELKVPCCYCCVCP